MSIRLGPLQGVRLEDMLVLGVKDFVVLGWGVGGTVVWRGTVRSCSVAKTGIGVQGWDTVMLRGMGWACLTAEIGMGALGLGTVVPLWHGVAVLSL